MSQQSESLVEIAINSKKSTDLADIGKELSQERLVWLSGYFTGQAEANSRLAEIFQKLGSPEDGIVKVPPIHLPSETSVDGKTVEIRQITILYGSHSGNAAGFAKLAKEMGEKRNYKIKLQNMADYNIRDLKNEEKLLIIVSTYGDGVPPFAAEELHEYIHSKRAPKLDSLKYSVLALGDRSYFDFCRTGIEFDTQLEALGAERVYKRVDCDVDYKNDAGKWLYNSLEAFDKLYEQNHNISGISIKSSVETNELQALISEENPYYAEIINKVKLNGRGSNKETYHIELSIEGSGISYKPGDSVGVKAANSEILIKDILKALTLTGNEKVQTKSGTISLKEALKNDFELTTINTDIIKKYNEKAQNQDLRKIIETQVFLKDFIANNDVLDLLTKYPAEFSAYEFIQILRPMSARLYSISSSPGTYTDELHLTVEAMRNTSDGRIKNGCCSTFFADQLEVGDKVGIFIKSNESFRLPLNYDSPVIMVGAGTGIAPFRSFVGERAHSGASGKNWLIFGNQHFNTDFLYQTEWQEHLKSGVLNKISLAFSRDQEEKIYVQHKILQNSKEIYDWISNNAHIYVCGDKNNMGNFVYKTFIDVIEKEGGLSEDAAHAYVRDLKKRGLYLEDVY